MDTMTMVINFSYVISAVLFIFGLKMLSSPATARRGNTISAIGMLLAIEDIEATLKDKGRDLRDQPLLVRRFDQ